MEMATYRRCGAVARHLCRRRGKGIPALGPDHGPDRRSPCVERRLPRVSATADRLRRRRRRLGVCGQGHTGHLPGRHAHRRWELLHIIDAAKTEKVCFATNLKEGQCYLIDISAETVNPVACAEAGYTASATTGAMKVDWRIEGSIDGSRCSAGDHSLGVHRAWHWCTACRRWPTARRHERVRGFRYRGVRPDSRLGG